MASPSSSAHHGCQGGAPWGPRWASAWKVRSCEPEKVCWYVLVPSPPQLCITETVQESCDLWGHDVTSEKTSRRWCIFHPFFFKQKYQPCFNGHRVNKIFSPGDNYFCWVRRVFWFFFSFLFFPDNDSLLPGTKRPESHFLMWVGL